MTSTFDRRSFLGLGAATLSLAALPTLAQPGSGKPVRMILPVGPGSGVDTIIRSISPEFARTLGQPVVVENMPGAGGVIGTSAIVKSPPDGLHIGVVSNNHVTNPAVYKNLPFDPVGDITPISVVGSAFSFATSPFTSRTSILVGFTTSTNGVEPTTEIGVMSATGSKGRFL